MPRNDKKLKEIRNASIVEAYQKLIGIKENNVQKYSHEYILQKLSVRFFLKPDTIFKIIRNESY